MMDTEFSGSVRTAELSQRSRHAPLGAMTVIEMARAADVTPSVVRHYTRIGLLTPNRDQTNGYKLFSRADYKRLLFIRRAKLLGYTLADIRNILADAQHGASACPRVRRIIRQHITKNKLIIAELIELQARMEQALRIWEEMPDGLPDGNSVCRLIESVTTRSDGYQ